MIVIKFSSKLSFQESDDTSSISESHTESFKKQFEQTGQFIDERRETEEEQLQEPSQGIPNNSLIIQQSPLKFRLKKSYNPKRLNSYPQLAFQGNIYLFLRKAKSLECLNYRCKNMKHCKGKMHVSYDHKVIKQKAHSCNGCIDNATIVSVFSKIIIFNLFVILFFIIKDPRKFYRAKRKSTKRI